MKSKESIAIFDLTSGKSLVLVPQEKQALVLTLNTHNDAEKSSRRNWLADLKKTVGHKNAKEIGSKTLENRLCKGWQVAKSDRTVTVWADQKTAEMVRVEIDAGIVRTVMSDFKFYPDVDESQFSLKAPDGYEVVVNATVAEKDASEDDIVLLLRAWAGGNGDVFPDTLMNQADWFKAAGKYDWSKEKQAEDVMTKAISRAFFQLYGKQDWVYRGKGVKLGSAKEAVFWTPLGNGKYRVIYGNLSVRQADKKDLPQ